MTYFNCSLTLFYTFFIGNQERPGRCPRANMMPMYPNVGFHKVFKVTNTLDTEGHYLDAKDKSDKLLPGDLTKTDDKESQPRSSERLFIKPSFFKPANQLSVVNTCRMDMDCPPPQKCCLVQVAKYVYREACRHPASNYDSYASDYWY